MKIKGVQGRFHASACTGDKDFLQCQMHYEMEKSWKKLLYIWLFFIQPGWQVKNCYMN